MAEYIEREAAIAAAFSAKAVGNSTYRDVYDTVSRLRLIPAADVRENVRGEWKSTHSWTPEIRCSICGYIEPVVAGENIEQPARNFCPNCGARMDEDG